MNGAVSRILAALVIVLGALLIGAMFAGGSAGEAMSSPVAVASLISASLVLLLVSGWFLSSVREQGARRMMQYALIWIAVGGVLALAYQVFG